MTARKSHRKSARPGSGKAPGTRSSRPAAFSARQVGPFLTGASLALLFAGFGERMYQLIGFVPRAYCVSIPLLAGALCAGNWIANRFAGIGDKGGRLAADAQINDRRAVAASVASLLASLLIFVLPNWIAWAELARGSLLQAFLWSRESVILLDAMVSVTAVLPLVVVGAILAIGGGVAEPFRDRTVSRTTTMLAGGGMALTLLGAFGSVDLVARAGIRLAAAPLLVWSVWVVAHRWSPPPPPRRAARVDQVQEPELRNRWPTLLRLAVAIGVICAGTAGAMWTHVASVMWAGSFRVTLVAAGLAVLGMAIGLWAAAREQDAGRSIADCGAACALGGGAMAAAVLAFGAVNSAADSPFHRSVGFAGLFLWCLMPVTILIGRAIGVTELAVVRRGGGERSARRFEHLLLFCGSMGISVASWWSLRFLGSFAAFAAIALTLLAAGGVLMIHDPTGGVDGRRRRVAMIFVAVMAMTVTLPLIQKGWLRNRQYRRTGVVESWWAAYGLRQDEVAVLYADDGWRPNLRRDELSGIAPEGDSRRTAVFGIINAAHPDLGPDVDQVDLRPDQPLAWLDRLGRSRERYDCLILAMSAFPDDLVRRICSAGALDAALHRVAPGGRLVVITSNANRLDGAMRSLTTRLERSGMHRIRQFFLGKSGHPAIEFVARDDGRRFAVSPLSVAASASRADDPQVAAATR